jgi:hypothetical protein
LANDITSSINLPVKSVEDVEPLQLERRKQFRVFIRDCDGISDGTLSGGRLGNPDADAIAACHSAEISYRQFGGYVFGLNRDRQ